MLVKKLVTLQKTLSKLGDFIWIGPVLFLKVISTANFGEVHKSTDESIHRIVFYISASLCLLYPFSRLPIVKRENPEYRSGFLNPWMLLGIAIVVFGNLTGYLQNFSTGRHGDSLGGALLLFVIFFSPIGWAACIAWIAAIILRISAALVRPNFRRTLLVSARLTMLLVCAFFACISYTMLTAPPPDETGA